MQSLGVQAAWDESLVITGEDAAQVEDIDDDLSRELAFYNQVCKFSQPPHLHTLCRTSRRLSKFLHVI